MGKKTRKIPKEKEKEKKMGKEKEREREDEHTMLEEDGLSCNFGR